MRARHICVWLFNRSSCYRKEIKPQVSPISVSFNLELFCQVLLCYVLKERISAEERRLIRVRSTGRTVKLCEKGRWSLAPTAPAPNQFAHYGEVSYN